MKKSILVVIAILGFSISAHAGWYAGGNIGYAIPTDSDWDDPAFGGVTLTIELEPGFALAGFGGYDFGKFRLEGELSWQKNDFDTVSGPGGSLTITGDLTATSFLVNGYFDFHNSSPATPFITAGIGFSKIEVNDFNVPGSGVPGYSDDDTVFAGQIGAGVGFAIIQNGSLDFKYRYFLTEDPSFDTSEFSFSSHNIYVGFRYNF